MAAAYLLFPITDFVILIVFLSYLYYKKVIIYAKVWKTIVFVQTSILPILFLSSEDFGLINDCCGQTATFSSADRTSIYSLIFICIIVNNILLFRKKLFTPFIEVGLMIFQLMGLILNIVFCFHFITPEESALFVIFGNIPIILILLISFGEFNKLLKQEFESQNFSLKNKVEIWAYKILNLNSFYKYPLLIIFILPITTLIVLLLLLFGQQPDSLIRAFTETYHHGFSQLDYMCDNVQCGGHFLCSVGANGHKKIVKPIRYGVRNGNKIICTRQLLISNAFEDLVQEKFPKLHKLIRNNYNRVGNIIHKYYYVFNIKIVSDFIYFLMKPLEYFFLICLYLFDKKPENRIAIQYLNKNDIAEIKSQMRI